MACRPNPDLRRVRIPDFSDVAVAVPSPPVQEPPFTQFYLGVRSTFEETPRRSKRWNLYEENDHDASGDLGIRRDKIPARRARRCRGVAAFPSEPLDSTSFNSIPLE
jgi:hypothetical protein